MLNPADLQTNNFVFRKSDMLLTQVKEVGIDKVTLWCNPLCWFNKEDIEPAMITDDILKVHKFTTYRDEFYFPVGLPSNVHHRRLSLCPSDTDELGNTTEYFVCYDHDNTGLYIKYIHELQQVFKLYTKNELELKL